MSRWLCTLALACAAAAAQAMPAEGDLHDHGLLTPLEDAAHTEADHPPSLIASAMGLLGTPYKRGGNSAATGFDCSGFVRAVYEQTLGLLLPRRADQQAAATQTIDKQELQPGDLVFFNTMRRQFSHVGIYLGDNKFIHAPSRGKQVRVDDMGGPYWKRRFNGARRVEH